MGNKVVLVSDDIDFFDFIKLKLELRRSDELYTFSFDSLLEKLHLLETAVLIVNSEGAKEKTLDLLKILKGSPVLVSAYNEDDVYRRKCYRNGAFDFLTPLTPDAEFRSRMLPALAVSSLLEKNKRYRDILLDNNILSKNNEVFINYEYIIDKELAEINSKSKKAVFAAISPSDNKKFLLNIELIEATILNNIRCNDILMNYATSKYFLFMYDIDIPAAEKVWAKINAELPEKVYAGFCNVLNQKRNNLINEALNKLHHAINNEKEINVSNSENVMNNMYMPGLNSNFKMYRQEFGKKLEQVISPIFYQIQQKYSDKISGASFEHGLGEGYGTFYIKGKYSSSCFRITSPGFSKINIDITYQKDSVNVDAKRITLEPEELEPGLLEDLLEQFILEYKKGEANAN